MGDQRARRGTMDRPGLAALLIDAYGLAPPVSLFRLEHAGLNNVNTGVQTGAGAFVMRVYESLSYADPAAIEYEHRLLAWLAGQNLSFAVPLPLPTRDGAPCFQGPGGWTTLTPLLPGSPLARQPYDHALLGAATGELQAALRRRPVSARPGRPLFSELFDFPRPGLDPPTLCPGDVGLPATPANDGLFGWWREQAARLDAFATGEYRELPAQVSHNDVTPNNVLAERGAVTAVLDFEYVAPSARALDFVTGLRNVMEYWKEPEPWAAARAYCRGFARWVTLTEREIAAIPDLLRLRAAITVLWWIGRAAAGEQDGLLASRLGFFQELVTWLAGAEDALADLLRQELGR